MAKKKQKKDMKRMPPIDAIAFTYLKALTKVHSQAQVSSKILNSMFERMNLRLIELETKWKDLYKIIQDITKEKKSGS